MEASEYRSPFFAIRQVLVYGEDGATPDKEENYLICVDDLVQSSFAGGLPDMAFRVENIGGRIACLDSVHWDFPNAIPTVERPVRFIEPDSTFDIPVNAKYVEVCGPCTITISYTNILGFQFEQTTKLNFKRE